MDYFAFELDGVDTEERGESTRLAEGFGMARGMDPERAALVDEEEDAGVMFNWMDRVWIR